MGVEAGRQAAGPLARPEVPLRVGREPEVPRELREAPTWAETAAGGEAVVVKPEVVG